MEQQDFAIKFALNKIEKLEITAKSHLPLFKETRKKIETKNFDAFTEYDFDIIEKSKILAKAYNAEIKNIQNHIYLSQKIKPNFKKTLQLLIEGKFEYFPTLTSISVMLDNSNFFSENNLSNKKEQEI